MSEFGGGPRRFGGPRRDFGGGPRRSFGPREMHKAICADCQKECEVPFKPAEGRPVYCKECYMKRKDGGAGSSPAQQSDAPAAEETTDTLEE